MQLTNSITLKEILYFTIPLFFLGAIAMLFRIKKIQSELNEMLTEDTKTLTENSEKLKIIKKDLDEQPKKLTSFEREHIIEEIRKISGLWRSRKERLRKGLWEKIELGTKESEDYKVEDEKAKLQKEKERIEELIKRAKIKYRTREIDEQSFREIMKDYQKELMEITLRLSELK
ncbi:MAG: hypothetical protein QXY62_02010 [Candidatus Altiarchaeota archaeon]